VAEKTNTCGASTLTYDESCFFVCICTGDACSWTITCGAVQINGKGKARIRDPRPGTRPRPGDSVKVDGTLGMIAKALEKKWRRPLVVPRGARDRRIQKTVKGKREEIAKALGLRLG
jgi:hypothetical protein